MNIKNRYQNTIHVLQNVVNHLTYAADDVFVAIMYNKKIGTLKITNDIIFLYCLSFSLMYLRSIIHICRHYGSKYYIG